MSEIDAVTSSKAMYARAKELIGETADLKEQQHRLFALCLLMSHFEIARQEGEKLFSELGLDKRFQEMAGVNKLVGSSPGDLPSPPLMSLLIKSVIKGCERDLVIGGAMLQALAYLEDREKK